MRALSCDHPWWQAGIQAPSFMISDSRHRGWPIVFTSPGFTALTGYTAEEAMGKSCRFLQGVLILEKSSPVG